MNLVFALVFRPALWVLMLVLVLGACSTAPPTPPSTAAPAPTSAASSASGPRTGAAGTGAAGTGTARAQLDQRNDIAMFALGLLNTPYRWGGRGPATGFDCSGLVSHVFAQAVGLRVGGSSADLGRKVRPVASGDLLPGDLVFFNTLGARHSHVGVYVGGGRFVHASNPRTGVRVDALSNRYYAQRFEGAGSLLD